MYKKCLLHGFCRMIELTIRDVQSLEIFCQVDGKKPYDKSLRIVKTDL